MKKLIIALITLAAVSILATSCGGGSQPAEQSESAAVTPTSPSADLPADSQAMMNRGYEIYKTKCMACHQDKGQGVDNIFPPLANSDYLVANKVRAVAQTLNGSKIEMVVNGKKYNREMPSQVATKEDAVAVINYVLNNFGNKGGFVTHAEVQHVEVKPLPSR
jgi:mono/diheme cytochrome c family protein